MASKGLLAGMAALLLVGLSLQIFGKRVQYGQADISGVLGRTIPRRVPGWNSTDLPLGATELVRDQTAKLLRYDDYVYRQFRGPDHWFAVYAAYWSAGKMPTRLIAIHTPDRCWIENGWSCKGRSFNASIQLGDRLQHGVQWRMFTPPEQGAPVVYVLYWMNVGGEPYDFGHELAASSRPLQWWGNFVKEMTAKAKPQYFIRLTSDRPFEELQVDPGFEQVLGALAKLGLRARGTDGG